MQNEPHVNSWYAASANQQLDFPALRGTVQTDVCVIGGGYTGLSTAIHLRQRGYSVTLLEARRVGWGASGRNGGHVGTGQRVDQRRLERWVGRERARDLWQLGLEAVATVDRLIAQYAIDCDLRRGNLHVTARTRETDDLRAEVEHLDRVYDFREIRYVERAELAAMTSARGFQGGTLNLGARHLHPLNYALGLARAARDLEVMGKKQEALDAFQALATAWPDGLEDERARIDSLTIDIDGAKAEWDAAEAAEAAGDLEKALRHYRAADRYYADWRDGKARIARLEKAIAEQKAKAGGDGGDADAGR